MPVFRRIHSCMRDRNQLFFLLKMYNAACCITTVHLEILGHSLTLSKNPQLSQLSVTKPSDVSLQFENIVCEYMNKFSANIFSRVWRENPVKVAAQTWMDFLTITATTTTTFHHPNRAEPVVQVSHSP